MLDASAMLLPTPPAECRSPGSNSIVEARLLEASLTQETQDTLHLSVWSTTCRRPHPRAVAGTRTGHRVRIERSGGRHQLSHEKQQPEDNLGL